MAIAESIPAGRKTTVQVRGLFTIDASKAARPFQIESIAKKRVASALVSLREL